MDIYKLHVRSLTHSRVFRICLLSITVLSLAGLGTWLVMPEWLKNIMIFHSPSFSLSYRACRDPKDIDTFSDFASRDAGNFRFLISRLSSRDRDDRCKAALFLGRMLGGGEDKWNINSSVSLRNDLVSSLLNGFFEADPLEQIDRSIGLCWLYPDIPVQPLIETWSRMPSIPRRVALAKSIGRIDNPDVCKMLVAWFQETSETDYIYPISRQTDSRAYEFLLGALRSRMHLFPVIHSMENGIHKNRLLMEELKEIGRDTSNLLIAESALHCLYTCGALDFDYLIDMRESEEFSPLHKRVESLFLTASMGGKADANQWARFKRACEKRPLQSLN